jgi:hypothetical protein
MPAIQANALNPKADASGTRPRQIAIGMLNDAGYANHIKAWKSHFAPTGLSRGAYWLLWSLRRVMPRQSSWRVMQFDTLRLRLIKLAARVVELKTQIKIHLPSSAPDQRSSPCFSTVCGAWSPESRGMAPLPSALFL